MRRTPALVGWSLCILAASGCARVGATGAVLGSGSGPVPPTEASNALALPPAIHLTGAAATLPEYAAADLDPILYTAASSDPGVLDDTTRWLRHWTTAQAQSFERYLERMDRYEHVVDTQLVARGMPLSLRYLPIVESGYSPFAASHVGAVGLWQIMDPTARELGLTVSPLVDDRRDPIASTDAALDYLEQLHDEFDSWLLALAAYNGGPARVRRLLDRYDSQRTLSPDRQYLAIRPHLPAETREFVPRLLAAAALGEQPEAYGFDAPVGAPLLYDDVEVPDATSLDVIARAAGTTEDEIRVLNPQFIRGFTPVGERRTVRVPSGHGPVFRRAYALIPPDRRLTLVEHFVEAGETLTHIARRYGVSLSDLTESNSGLDPRRLRIGALVIVPISRSGED